MSEYDSWDDGSDPRIAVLCASWSVSLAAISSFWSIGLELCMRGKSCV